MPGYDGASKEVIVQLARRMKWLLVGGIAAVGVGFGLSSTASDAELPDLTGRWMTVQRLVAVAELPFVGEVTFVTVLGLFSEGVQTGAGLILQDAYCFTDIEVSTDLFATDIPDATMRAIRSGPRRAELRREADATWLMHDWHTEVRGAVLDDPVHDPLPTSRSDPRIVDTDGDGQPGITLSAELVGLFGGDTYAVQRFRYRLEGKLVDEDTIVGYVEWSSEQEIVWASDALLMTPFTEEMHPDPTVHRFAMRRIDAGWDCTMIRDRVAPLLELLDGSLVGGGP